MKGTILLVMLVAISIMVEETGSMSVSRSGSRSKSSVRVPKKHGNNQSARKPKEPNRVSILPATNVTYLSTADMNNIIDKNLNCSQTPVHKIKHRPKRGNGTMCTSKALHHCSKTALSDIKKSKSKKATMDCIIRQKFFSCFQANDSRKPCKDGCRENVCSNVPCKEKNPKAAKKRVRDVKKLADFLWKSRQCVYSV